MKDYDKNKEQQLSQFSNYSSRSPVKVIKKKPTSFLSQKTVLSKEKVNFNPKSAFAINSINGSNTVRLRNVKINDTLSKTQLYTTTDRSTSQEDKEIASHLLNELEAMESEINTPTAVSVTPANFGSNIKTVNGFGTQKTNEYLSILARTNAFKSEKDKSQYLIKELENANIKNKILENTLKAIRKEYEDLKNQGICVFCKKKAQSPAPKPQTDPDKEKLKKEVDDLKKIISQQNQMLDRFKKEVMEKFCSSNMK